MCESDWQSMCWRLFRTTGLTQQNACWPWVLVPVHAVLTMHVLEEEVFWRKYTMEQIRNVLWTCVCVKANCGDCIECLWLLVLLHFKHPTLLFNLNILVTNISLLSFYDTVYPQKTKACSPRACENEWHPQQKQMGILSWICRTVWSPVYHQLPATHQQYSKLDGSLEMTTQVTVCTISQSYKKKKKKILVT